MPRTSFRRRRPGGGGRRKYTWVTSNEGYSTASQAVAVGATTLSGLIDTYSAGASPGMPQNSRFTIERILGEICTQHSGSWTTGDGVIGCFGIYISPVQSGGTAVTTWDPSSANDADKPWMWLGHAAFSNEIGGGALSEGMAPRYPVDVRVKRVMRPDERLILASRNLLVAGPGTTRVWPFLRVLISNVA